MTPSSDRSDDVCAIRGLRYAANRISPGEVTFATPDAWPATMGGLLDGVDPHSVLHLMAPVLARGGTAAAAHEVRSRLEDWVDQAVLVRDREPCVYIYRRRQYDAELVGLIAGVRLTEARRSPLREHEAVIPALVDIQEALEAGAAAQVEPVLTIHRTAPALRAELEAAMAAPPDTRFESAEGLEHTLWAVSEPARRAALIREVPEGSLLIADGHHRHAAWARQARARGGPWAVALAMLVDARLGGLALGPVHRVLAGFRLDDLSAYARVVATPLPGPREADAYLADGPTARSVWVSGGRFWAVVPAAGYASGCSSPELAVCHLHDRWLADLGVAEHTVSYVHDREQAVELAGDVGVAVLLPTPSVEAVFAAADEGRPLPRKATSFGPKPQVGMVLRHWGDGSDVDPNPAH